MPENKSGIEVSLLTNGTVLQNLRKEKFVVTDIIGGYDRNRSAKFTITSLNGGNTFTLESHYLDREEQLRFIGSGLNGIIQQTSGLEILDTFLINGYAGDIKGRIYVSGEFENPCTLRKIS